jgi:glucose-1-phosphate cytidylyltransferase
MTGGRLKRIAPYLDDEDFCFTYGDGVSDVNIAALIAFHREQNSLATVTAVQPPGRFGSLTMQNHSVTSFKEKPHGDNAWINGGYFVLSPKVIDYIDGDAIVWEKEPLQALASQGELAAYHHDGFWLPMDTLRDKVCLEELWNENRAPWKCW